MNKLEDIARPCVMKIIMEEDKKYSVENIISWHGRSGLYDCVKCKGTPGSCHNYADHKALIEKYKNDI